MHITIKWKKNVSLNKQLVDGDKAQIMHDWLKLDRVYTDGSKN